MFKLIIRFGTFWFLLTGSFTSRAQEIHSFSPGMGSVTLKVRNAIEKSSASHIRLIFEKGVYFFEPDLAVETYTAITNHNNGLKRIIFPFEGLESVEIIGNGAEFIFRGQVMPFQFKNCNGVKIENLSVDWDIPFTFQGVVVKNHQDSGFYDLRPYRNGFNWKLNRNRIRFPVIEGFSFSSLGSTLEYEKDTRRVAHGVKDFYSQPEKIEQLDTSIIRIHEKLEHFPKEGNILHYKGPMNENRYAPALHLVNSKNILIQGVIIHHALGMGFLAERSENIRLTECGVYVKENSERVVSIIADATHFCNCRGEIVLKNCRFEHMLDDGTNVHGTYVEVNNIINKHSLRYELKHFQQLGFEFAAPGDTIWFVHQPSMTRNSENIVRNVHIVNERFAEIEFSHPLPGEIRTGDLLENKTWNPSFTMQGCTIKDHRARGIVLKTPKPILIEKNYFSSMMSAVFIRGESHYWFESGAVENVLIRNNHFSHCAYSGMEHAILYVTPRFGRSFSSSATYDSNIHFVDNTIETFDNRIVWANRVNGLLVKNNKIIQTSKAASLFPSAPLFEFSDCMDVKIFNNQYSGHCENAIKIDTRSSKTLLLKGNSGLPGIEKYKR